MTYTVTINMDNEAFEDVPNELTLIIAKVAAQNVDRDCSTPWEGKLFDRNGNTVGEAKVTP